MRDKLSEWKLFPIKQPFESHSFCSINYVEIKTQKHAGSYQNIVHPTAKFYDQFLHFCKKKTLKKMKSVLNVVFRDFPQITYLPLLYAISTSQGSEAKYRPQDFVLRDHKL